MKVSECQSHIVLGVVRKFSAKGAIGPRGFGHGFEKLTSERMHTSPVPRFERAAKVHNDRIFQQANLFIGQFPADFETLCSVEEVLCIPCNGKAVNAIVQQGVD